MMRDRFASAIWGSDRVDGADDSLRILPITEAPSPSMVGRVSVDATRHAIPRIAAAAVRKDWPAQRDRRGCNADSFVELEGDVALELVMEELKRVRADLGDRATFGNSYSWASAGRFHRAQSQLDRFLDMVDGNVGAADTDSHAAVEASPPVGAGAPN